MSYNFLELTNEVIARFNEVHLTEGGFNSARGFQVQCKNAVNDAIKHINQREYSWPFNHQTNSVVLTAGTTRYTFPSITKHVDFETFRLVKDEALGSSGYSLKVLDYKEYLDRYINQEDADDVGSIPTHVFRTPDNNFGLYPYPDKAYTLRYEYYTNTNSLVNAQDVPAIPEMYRQVIVDGATAYGYQYRGETEQYQLNFQRFDDGITNMQSILLNRTDYIRSTVITRR